MLAMKCVVGVDFALPDNRKFDKLEIVSLSVENIRPKGPVQPDEIIVAQNEKVIATVRKYLPEANSVSEERKVALRKIYAELL